jgi:hypothetical protein
VVEKKGLKGEKESSKGEDVAFLPGDRCRYDNIIKNDEDVLFTVVGR